MIERFPVLRRLALVHLKQLHLSHGDRACGEERSGDLTCDDDRYCHIEK